MILQRLTKYYDRLIADPAVVYSLPKPGYSLQKVSFCVVLEPDGLLPEFQSLLDSAVKKPIPRQLLVPGQSKPTGSGINPCFLWDNAAYMLGYKLDDPKPERTRESFDEFRKRHLEAESQVKSTSFSAVCNFLRNWSPEKAIERAGDLKEITGSFGVFRIKGEHRYVHDDPTVLAYWTAHESADVGGPRALCLVSGEDEPIARVHQPKIKGVRDTQSAGALLVSYNDKAYESFGKEQGDNGPVGVTAAFKYTNALNALLNRSDRRFSLGDATVVFWAERANKLEEFVSDI